MSSRAKFLSSTDGRLINVLGSVMNVKASSDETGGAFDVVVVESGPGGDIIPHRHPWGEIYFILDGEMDVQVGRQVRSLTAGAFINIPPRALHGFRVTSEQARFLHVSAGSGALEAFEDYQRHVPHTPTLDDLEAVLAVNARHGIDVVLPTSL